MENNKLLSMLGLSYKAGQLLQGFDAVTDATVAKQAYLVLVAEDIAEGTRKKVRKAAEESGVDYFDIDLKMHQLEELTGKRAGVLAITDKNFACGIKKIIATQSEGGTRIDDRKV